MKSPYVYKRYKKILHIYDPIYRDNIWILVSTDKNDYFKLYKKQFNSNPPDNVEYDRIQARYSVCEIEKNDGIYDIHIIWLKKMSIPNLCHETLHCIRRILSQKGIELSEYTDEVYAYYQEFIVKSALNGFNKKED